jgi:hypothetical protein
MWFNVVKGRPNSRMGMEGVRRLRRVMNEQSSIPLNSVDI